MLSSSSWSMVALKKGGKGSRIPESSSPLFFLCPEEICMHFSQNICGILTGFPLWLLKVARTKVRDRYTQHTNGSICQPSLLTFWKISLKLQKIARTQVRDRYTKNTSGSTSQPSLLPFWKVSLKLLKLQGHRSILGTVNIPVVAPVEIPVEIAFERTLYWRRYHNESPC